MSKPTPLCDIQFSSHSCAVERVWGALCRGRPVPFDVVVAGDAAWAGAWRGCSEWRALESVLRLMGRLADVGKCHDRTCSALHMAETRMGEPYMTYHECHLDSLRTVAPPTIAEMVAASEKTSSAV